MNMAGNYPPGCTQKHVDMAAPGYWDEPEEEEEEMPQDSMAKRVKKIVPELLGLADCDARAGEPLGKCMRRAAALLEEQQAALAEARAARK